jgi:hypothetical protein
LELNESLIAAGLTPLAIDATPISMAFAQNEECEGAPGIPIQILSDNEENPSRPSDIDQPATETAEIEESVPQTSLPGIDPPSAMVLYSGLVYSQPAIQLFAYLKPSGNIIHSLCISGFIAKSH